MKWWHTPVIFFHRHRHHLCVYVAYVCSYVCGATQSVCTCRGQTEVKIEWLSLRSSPYCLKLELSDSLECLISQQILGILPSLLPSTEISAVH